FGKHRKDERPGEKLDRKGSSKWRTEESQVSDEETMKMRMDQERIQAKTRELRERQARERDYAEVLDVSREEEEEDHPYAGVNALNCSMDSGHSRPHSPRDDYIQHQNIHPNQHHQNNHPHHQNQHSDSLYTQVKARNERPPSADRVRSARFCLHILVTLRQHYCAGWLLHLEEQIIRATGGRR
ncbi:hypothetical protein NQZ68_034279, partial [Dissostichus eleginoides]